MPLEHTGRVGAHRCNWPHLGLAFIAGAIAVTAFNTGLERTNDMAFCTSCHSMQFNLEELRQSVHYTSRSGVTAGCADCHVPREYGPKLLAKLHAWRDVWHEILGTIDSREKFEQRRWELANRVWARMQASDSRECRACHQVEHMDLDGQDRIAAKRHAAMQTQGKTCIDCHKGIAHEEPEQPDEGVTSQQEQHPL